MLVAQLLYNVAKLSSEAETENMNQTASSLNTRKLSKLVLPKATKEDMQASNGFQTMTSFKTASTETNSIDQSTKKTDRSFISHIQSLVDQLESTADPKSSKENEHSENVDLTRLLEKVKEELAKLSKVKQLTSQSELQNETVIKTQPFTLKPVKKNKI